MSKVILLNPGSGEVHILHPAIDCGLSIEEIAEKDCGGLPYEIVDRSELPTDRVFRDAWELDDEGKKIKVNMNKATAIHSTRLEKATAKEADRLIKEEMKADDRDDNSLKQQLKAERKALRKAVDDIDLSTANTPEELALIWPHNLPQE